MELLKFLILDSSKDFNAWLKANAIWLAIASCALIAIALAFILLLGKKKKSNSNRVASTKVVSKSEYLEALGGEENILDKKLEGRRIVLTLKDNSLLDKEKIKEAGVDGFIMMTSRVTLVIKGDASKVYEVIFGKRD